MTNRSKPLSGVRVIDLGLGMCAALAAKLLVEAGADVIRFEPAQGDPFYDIYPAYRLWQQGKTILPISPDGLLAELETADICLIGGEDYPDLLWTHDAAALRTKHPQLVLLDIKASPTTDPSAAFPAIELFAQAQSGLSFEHHPDRPIMLAFPAASYGAALHGVAALLALFWSCRETGDGGGIVTTSLLQGALAWGAGLWGEVEHAPPSFNALIPKGVVDARFRCADGAYLHFTPGVPGSYAKLFKVLEIDDPAMDPNARGIPTGNADPKLYFGDMERVGRHAALKNSDEVLAGLHAEGLPVERVIAPGACWDLPQTSINDVIARNDAGWQYVASPIAIEPLAEGGHRSSPAPDTDNKGPLAGVRVVDVGSFAAGPYSSVILGDLGADVIKLERLEGDPMRLSFHHYSASNRGKRSIAIDAKHPQGPDVIARICASADVVHHNFRPGVSAKMGLDATALSQRHPGIIVLEASAYGFNGPMAHLPGFDPLFQSIAGHQIHAGGPGNAPLYYRIPIADYGTGLLGAIAIVEALLLKQRARQGAATFVSLLSSAIFLLSELVRRPDGEFEPLPGMAASQLGFHPSEALYQTADGWIAIAARGEPMARRLAQILALETELASPAADWGTSEVACLSQAIRAQTTAALLAMFKSADVWAVACVRDLGDALRQPGMEDIGMVFSSRDDDMGQYRLIGRAVSIADMDLPQQDRAMLAPIGFHTRSIMAECGYADDEIDALFAAGVIA